jgi:hypothetical protein
MKSRIQERRMAAPMRCIYQSFDDHRVVCRHYTHKAILDGDVEVPSSRHHDRAVLPMLCTVARPPESALHLPRISTNKCCSSSTLERNVTFADPTPRKRIPLLLSMFNIHRVNNSGNMRASPVSRLNNSNICMYSRIWTHRQSSTTFSTLLQSSRMRTPLIAVQSSGTPPMWFRCSDKAPWSNRPVETQ